MRTAGAGAGAEIHADLMGQAVAHYQAGRLSEARRAAKRVLGARPDDIDALHLYGCAAMELGDFDASIGALQSVVAYAPQFAEAHDNLGNSLMAVGRLEEAEAAFRRAIAAKPAFAAAHNNLGNVLDKLRDFEAAAEAYRRALGIDPNSALAHNNLGTALQHLGAFEEAEAAYRKAIEIEPDLSATHNNLGSLLQSLGRLEDAEAALRQALAIKPDYATAFRHLSSLNSFSVGDADIRHAEKVLASATVTDDQVMDFSFALAKAYDDVGDYDRAFSHLEKGNRIKRASIAHDAGLDQSIIERTIAAFDRDVFARLAGNGFPSEAPIFIVGMPRSGTTLVEQIVASHSQVQAGNELQDFVRLGLELGERIQSSNSYPEAVADLRPEDLEPLGRAYVEQVSRRLAPTTRFTDKQTENFRTIGLIHLALPNAKIIHCLRDPVDTCLSCYKTYFVNDVDFAYDLPELGRHYRARTRLMDHWHTVLPGRILDIRYEDLVADQETLTRGLLEFCGLPWEDACLAFHENPRPVLTASAAQVRRPIYRDALNRWKHYERHLAQLFEALGH